MSGRQGTLFPPFHQISDPNGNVWATVVSGHKLAPQVPPLGQKRIQKR